MLCRAYCIRKCLTHQYKNQKNQKNKTGTWKYVAEFEFFVQQFFVLKFYIEKQQQQK